MTQNYTFEYVPTTHRTTFRVEYPQLSVAFCEFETDFTIKDISVGGLSFSSPPTLTRNFDRETTYQVIIKFKGKQITPPLALRLLHFSSSTIGGRFVDLDHRSEAILDKLILKIQKKNITLKKKDTDSCEKKSKKT